MSQQGNQGCARSSDLSTKQAGGGHGPSPPPPPFQLVSAARRICSSRMARPRALVPEGWLSDQSGGGDTKGQTSPPSRDEGGEGGQ